MGGIEGHMSFPCGGAGQWSETRKLNRSQHTEDSESPATWPVWEVPRSPAELKLEGQDLWHLIPSPDPQPGPCDATEQGLPLDTKVTCGLGRLSNLLKVTCYWSGKTKTQHRHVSGLLKTQATPPVAGGLELG